MPSVSGLIKQLYAKDNALASRSLRKLEEQSRLTAEVYACLPQLLDMLSHPSAYVRMRALALIAENARWDEDDQLAAALPSYLACIADRKPTVARQCIRRLPEIVRSKPQLAAAVALALRSAAVDGYPESMRALVAGDIEYALQQLARLQLQ